MLNVRMLAGANWRKWSQALISGERKFITAKLTGSALKIKKTSVYEKRNAAQLIVHRKELELKRDVTDPGRMCFPNNTAMKAHKFPVECFPNNTPMKAHKFLCYSFLPIWYLYWTFSSVWRKISVLPFVTYINQFFRWGLNYITCTRCICTSSSTFYAIVLSVSGFVAASANFCLCLDHCYCELLNERN